MDPNVPFSFCDCINFETGTQFRLIIWRAEGSDEWYEEQAAMENDVTEMIENKKPSIQKAK